MYNGWNICGGDELARMTLTKSGNFVDFLSPAKADIRSLKVYFSPKQLGEGTPSPDNVRDIVGWDSVKIEVRNENLVSVDADHVQKYNSQDITVADGAITSASGTCRISLVCEVEPNTTYRASVTRFRGGTASYFSIRGYSVWPYPYDVDSVHTIVTQKKHERNGTYNYTFTTLASTKYITFEMYKSSSSAVYAYKDFCLRKTGSGYIAPESQTLTIPFGQTIYGGYVDLVSGELVEEWTEQRVTSSSRIGIFPWGGVKTDSSTGIEYADALFMRDKGRAIGNLYAMCDKLPIGNRKINTGYVYDGDTYGPCLSLPTSLIGTTGESLKTYLEDNEFDFVWKLRVPITHQLTPQSLQTLINQNTFWTNADRIEIEYDLIESAEMMDIRKRILFNNNPHLGIGTLKYWWSGKDGPVLGSDNKYHWESRATGLKPELPQSTWIESEKCYLFNDSAYASLNLNDGNFTLGNHWRIVFDMDYMRGSNSGTFIDIGSVTSANKAIGLGISSAGRFNINWKMRGNESNPGCSISMPENLVPIDNQYHRLRGYYEIVDGGDGYDRFQVFVNGIKYICDVQIPQVWYGPTWQRSSGYFGRGITSGYAPKNVKFYDIKIYQID